MVCKNIFCCLECRNRHEMNAHNPNEVLTERNRLRCGLCQGYSTLEFQCRNDFALIMHLSEAHLPLHCRKCLTVNYKKKSLNIIINFLFVLNMKKKTLIIFFFS